MIDWMKKSGRWVMLLALVVIGSATLSGCVVHEHDHDDHPHHDDHDWH